MTALDLVKKFMEKAGVTHNGDLTADIPDEVVTALDNKLLTVAAAINNHPDVKKVYFAQAYNGMDAEIKGLFNEFGLSDEIRAEIEAAGGSVKKAAALARKLKEMGEKAQPADAAKAKELADKITELNSKLATEIAKQKQLETEYNTKLQQVKIKTKLSGMLAGYKTKFDDLDAEARSAAIEALINKSLQDSDADFTFDEKEALTLKKKDGTNLFGENHTLITPQAFLDKSLSKILKVTDPNAGKATPAATVPGAQQSQPNTALKEAVAASLTSYTEGTKAVAV